VVDFVAFGQSLQAGLECDSLGSCSLATVGIAVSLAGLRGAGGLALSTVQRVAVTRELAGLGLDTLRARISDKTLVELTVKQGGKDVTTDLTTQEADQLIDRLKKADKSDTPKAPAPTCARPMCFPAGTRVATPRGHTAIEKLHIGDLVLAEDPKTGTVEPEPVQALIVRPVSDLMALDLSDGSSIKVQPDHVFWVDNDPALRGQGWLKARFMHRGDRLRTVSSRDVTVVRLRWHVGRAVVYTLTVARLHTFFVGAAQVLVHNATVGNGGCVTGLIPQGDPRLPEGDPTLVGRYYDDVPQRGRSVSAADIQAIEARNTALVRGRALLGKKYADVADKFRADLSNELSGMPYKYSVAQIREVNNFLSVVAGDSDAGQFVAINDLTGYDFSQGIKPAEILAAARASRGSLTFVNDTAPKLAMGGAHAERIAQNFIDQVGRSGTDEEIFGLSNYSGPCGSKSRNCAGYFLNRYRGESVPLLVYYHARG